MAERTIMIGAAQMGPVQAGDARKPVVERMVALMRRARERGCDLVVFPQLALTTYFPLLYMEDREQIDGFFETEMPGPDTRPLFDAAERFGVGFYLGYGEIAGQGERRRHYNSAILVDGTGRIVSKYRKIHLPGHADHRPAQPFQQLEKRYFEVGDLGFPVTRSMGGNIGLCLCNDRHWPETYRVMALQGVELVLLGYNTTLSDTAGRESPETRSFQNALSMQAGAFHNSAWVVGVAKAGREEGVDMMGGSLIAAPTGEIVAQAETLDDELVVASCDLGAREHYKASLFNFAKHRRIEHYGMIAERTAAPEA